MLAGEGGVPRLVPADILILTCDACGEMALDGHASDAIAAAWAEEDA
jgi:hypothetical protein